MSDGIDPTPEAEDPWSAVPGQAAPDLPSDADHVGWGARAPQIGDPAVDGPPPGPSPWGQPQGPTPVPGQPAAQAGPPQAGPSQLGPPQVGHPGQFGPTHQPPGAWPAPPGGYAGWVDGSAGALPVEQSQAVLGFCLSLLGLLLAFACVVPILLCPFGWWICHKEIQAIDDRRRAGDQRGLAQAGKIIGIIGTVLLALGVLLLGAIAVLPVFAIAPVPA